MMDLSHLGKEVHRRYDELGIIQVFDDGNKRYLSFGTADEQSCQLRSRPDQPQHEYTRAMFAIITLLKEPQRAAVLGVGGGVLIRALFSYFPTLHIDAVDLRRAVILIAQQHFGLPRDLRIQAVHLPATDYLKQASPGSLNVLFSDLYLAEGLDKSQLCNDYLQLCASALADDGWLVLNLWKEHREDGRMLPLLRHHFATVLHATTMDGNWIVWANKSQITMDKKEIRQQAKRLSASLGFNLWQAARGFFRH